jgi:hypothetical protein
MMQKMIRLFIVLILSACTPQVTVTSEVTVTSTLPPTQTPIPTPTLHPQFVELQNLIKDSGDRFTLLPDGTIEELTADGGRQTIPNLHVDQNGVINIIFNNEHVRIEQSQVIFDDENGLTIEGYELNEQGAWVEAISQEIQSAMAEFDKYAYSTEGLEFKQNGDDVWAVDKESGKTVYEKDGDSEYGLFYQFWVVEQAGQLDLMPTDIEPDKTVLEGAGLYFVADRAKAFEYFGPLYKRVRVQFEEEYGYDPYIEGKSGTQRIMIIPEINAWGSVTKLAIEELSFGRYFWYELADGTIHIVPLK